MLAIGCLIPAAGAQPNRPGEVGYPYIRNFGPADFKAPEATWSTIQDDRGILYVGNQAGALEYDGVTWRLITTPKNTFVRTFARDAKTGRIYAGSSGDFGYLGDPDKTGRLRFVSLADKLEDKADRDFTDIWRTIAPPEGGVVYFLAHNRLFRYVDDRTPIKVWRPKVRFVFANFIRGTLYVSDATYGLQRMDGDTLVPVPGFEDLKDSRRLIVLPYLTDKMLIADRGIDDPHKILKSPLYLYDGSTRTPFPTEADDILRKHRLTIASLLDDGTYAFGTTGGGVIILDSKGKMLWHIDQRSGLANDSVYWIHRDKEGLWVNHSEGLSRVELPPPVSYFNAASGIEGAKLSMARHEESLYVGTTSGVYRLELHGEKPGDNKAVFRPVKHTSNLSGLALLSMHAGRRQRLVLGSSSGLFEIDGDNVRTIIAHSGARPYSVTCLSVSKGGNDRIFVGLEDGLASVRWDGRKWVDEGNFEQVPKGKRVQRIAEVPTGRLVLGTEANGIQMVDVSRMDAAGIPDRQAQPRDFHPEGYAGMNVFDLGGKLLFTSNDLVHLYRLNEASGQFKELSSDDPLASATPDANVRGFGFQTDSDDNVWTYRGRDLVFLKKNGDTYKADQVPVPHIASVGSLSAVLSEPGVTWFGSLRNLVRFDSAHAPSLPERKFRALIRGVTASTGAKGQVEIYGGAPGEYGMPRLNSAERTIRFDFAAPVSADESATEFETRLDGLDDDWTAASPEPDREYTNLPYRTLTFHVRGLDAEGRHSDEATYSFKVDAPWYRTWGAYSAYTIILAALLWYAARTQRRRVAARESEKARTKTAALEAEAKALNAEKDLLNEFSKDNASLTFEEIFLKLHAHVNELCDAAVFRAGRFYPEEHRLENRLVIEGGDKKAAFDIDTAKPVRMEAFCAEHAQAVLMGNAPEDVACYIETDAERPELLSRIYVPLISKGQVCGLVAIASPRRDAYTDYHLHLMQNLTAYTSIALDNAYAYQQLNSTLANLEQTVTERTATIESLSEVGRQITASLDLDTVLERVYRYVGEVADATMFGVGILIPEQHTIEYRLAMKQGKRTEHFHRDTWDHNQFAVWCIENRQPVVMNDVQTEYVRFIPEMDRKGVKADLSGAPRSVASLIYLPLITQDRVLGVITIQSFEKNAYTDYHVNLLKNLAAYTSIAIDNATAYKRLNEREREIQQRAAELATVNEVGQAAASQLEVQSLIELVGDKVREVFKAQVAYVALHEEGEPTIRFPYGYGREFPPVPMGRGMVSRVLLKGDPMLVSEEGGAASTMAVPILAGGEIAGVVGVETTEKDHRFAESDLRLLTTIASSVGVALHNARLFEETAQARRVAEEADATKSAFLSTVSHELRTPLTSVLGFAKIIKRRLSERLFPLIPQDDRRITQTMQQVSDNLDVVVSEGERLTKLIDEVLDLAKIEAGKLEWRSESLTAAEIIDRALAATSSLVENKPVALTGEVEPDLPGFTGDRDRLIQVVINLISNAVKFTSSGSVTCRARQNGNELVFSVTDTGLGIAADDQPKVFEKFKQVGNTLTDKPKGTGLGLPICKEIVEHHGGRIWVESEPGKGSTFLFSLPLKAEASAPPPLNLQSLVKRLRESVNGSANGEGKRTSILVVDDDPHIRELLLQEFQEAGHEVRLASDGREALNQVREEKPGLIVLDVMMPEMSGFDVAAVLKNDPATMDIPIIMLSIVEDKERGHRLGIDRYLTKPVDTEVLFREVDALMEQGKSKKKVMIVDEDESTVRTLTEVLQIRGYNVVETKGDDLIRQAMSVKPDVIILNSLLSSKSEIMQTLRFENGLENVLFLIYQ